MNLTTYFAKLDELYKFHLYEIDNIKFTKREIDIISCIMHNKGEKKIANILSISHRTVGTHQHNIMMKMEVSSRDLIINFIEKSGKSKLIDEYYFNLTTLMRFEAKLKLIGETYKSKPINIIINDNMELAKKLCIKSFKKHLQLANVIVCNKDNSDAKLNIHCILKSDNFKESELESIFLKLDKNIEYQSLNTKKIIDCSDKTNYYNSIFALIKAIRNDKQLTKTIRDFDHETVNLENNFNGIATTAQEPLYSRLIVNSLLFKISVVLIFLCIILFLSTLNHNQNKQIRYDLVLPHSSFLLERSTTLNKIRSMLSKEDIGIVALVGIGGSGKTILARNYAKKHKGNLIWEVNAETSKTLLDSFEQLAYAISEDSQDKQRLKNIQNITDLSERRKKLQIYITKHITNYHNWFFIYDNVNDFGEIADFFPHDKQVWGNGQVIITTRNSNIANNSLITEKNVIMVPALEDSEKINLFKKIIGRSKTKTHSDKNDLSLFAKRIPPFPLDIVTAASYIKNTGTSFSEYTKNITYPTNYFEKAQMGFLKSTGYYNNTRYGIITLSIKQLIDEGKDFQDLLLLISLLKSQNIPRDLLVEYKGEIVVHNFLRKIKMYSFVLINKAEHKSSYNSFNIHRTVQNISYDFLTKSIKPQEYQTILKSQINLVSNYLSKKSNNNIEFSEIKTLEGHSEKFLNTTKTSLSKEAQVALEIELANYYLKTTKLYKAKRLLKKCLKIAKLKYGKDSPEVSKIFYLLGVTYYNISEYGKARLSLKESIKINEKLFKIGSIEITESLFYLAIIESDIGQHFKAIKLFEPTSIVIQNHYGENHPKTARILMHLARALYRVGQYNRSEKLLNKVLSIYTNAYGTEHPRVAEALCIISSLYRQKGYYDDSIEMLNRALKIRLQEYGDDHVSIAEIKVKLAHTYRHLGKYDLSINHLKNAMTIYKNKYGMNNRTTAWSMTYLGHVFWDQGKIDDAIRLLTHASKILVKKHGTNDMYSAWNFLRLGYVLTYSGNYKKAHKFIEEGYKEYGKYYKSNHINRAWSNVYLGNFYNKTNNLLLAQSHLEKALETYQNHFGVQHIRTSWIKKILADNYNRQGDFAKALKYSKEAYDSYKLHYGDTHIKTALALQKMGQIYFFNGILEGESLVRKALTILENQNSTKIYSTLEIIADIEFNKAQEYNKNRNNLKAQNHYKTAQDYLDRALLIAKKNLPTDSQLIKAMEKKATELASNKAFK